MRDVDRDREQHLPLAAAGQKKAICGVNVFKDNKGILMKYFPHQDSILIDCMKIKAFYSPGVLPFMGSQRVRHN